MDAGSFNCENFHIDKGARSVRDFHGMQAQSDDGQ
jgi:hypothetical protein